MEAHTTGAGNQGGGTDHGASWQDRTGQEPFGLGLEG